MFYDHLFWLRLLAQVLVTCVVNVLRGGYWCIHTVETLLEIIKLYNMFFTNRILGTLQQHEKNTFIVLCRSKLSCLQFYSPPKLIVIWGRRERTIIVSGLVIIIWKKKIISWKAVNLNCTCPEIFLSSNMKIIDITIHTWTHISFLQIFSFVTVLEIYKLRLTFLRVNFWTWYTYM